MSLSLTILFSDLVSGDTLEEIWNLDWRKTLPRPDMNYGLPSYQCHDQFPY